MDKSLERKLGLNKNDLDETRKRELGLGRKRDREVWQTRPGERDEIEKRIAASAGSSDWEKKRKNQAAESEWKKSPYRTAEKTEI